VSGLKAHRFFSLVEAEMPRHNYPAELEQLQVDLEALRYYRRRRLINISPEQYKQRVKRLTDRIAFVEDKIAEDAEREKERERKEKAKEEREKQKKQRERFKRLKQIKKADETRKTQFFSDLKKRFEEDDEIRIEMNNRFVSDIDIINFVIRQPGRWVVRVGQTYYTLNDKTKVRLNQFINRQLITTSETTKSDEEVMSNIEVVEYIIVRRLPETHTYEIQDGAFFPYYHNTHYDFSRYGIYRNGDEADYEDNCLIYAFRMAEVEEKKLNELKLKIKNRNVPLKEFPAIAKILQAKLVVSYIDDKNKSRHTYGKEFETTYNLGLVEKHFFLIEPTEYTSYCINHYDEVKNKSNSNLIYNARGQPDASRCVNSYDLVKTLVANKDKLLTEISIDDGLIATTQFYDKARFELKNLEYDLSGCVKPVEYKEAEDKIGFSNVFFDFETYVKDGVHIPYLCRTYDGVNSNVYYGSDCGLQMLKDIRKHTRLIAHNATYDLRFLIQYLRGIEEISRGTRMISCSASFGKYLIQVKDSFHLISSALSKFPDMFQLPNIVKEVMPYDLYNEDTVKQRWLPIETALKLVAAEDHAQFLKNIDEWNLKRDDKYDILRYSSKYCEIDCKLLYQGYTTFRKWILELLSLDIDNILTTASLADRYFIKQGCYEGVNALGGVPQMFIQGTVVGGRTMVSENKKIAVSGRINDFDAVSLYPSAMYRMDGFLKGVPKVIENNSYDWLKQQDGYFVDILIRGVGKKRKFPLMSSKNEEGVRVFTNDMVGKTMRVDKYALEDLIAFQQIQFDVLRGYYFNEGFNTKINEVIKYLFDERARLKKLGNPAEQVYKLLMNSGYGKSIMKPIENEAQFFDNEDEFNVFLSRNYNWVRDYTYFGNKIRVNKIKTLDEHYNRAQVGSCILSMSKRIMNEVMCLAEDLGLDIFYQDTDSIHITDEDIPKLSSAFSSKYGKELIGKKLGQFHSDFDLKGCEEVYARRSIFLGKKSYIDELVGKNAEGKEVVGFHIRMKGIPNKVLLYHAKKLGYASPFEMYEDLNAGKPITFDLTNDGTKANFKFNKDYTINTLDNFSRTVRFNTSLYNQVVCF